MLLLILTNSVIDPREVKTVSKYKVSEEKLIATSWLVMKESFLHEKRKRMDDMVNIKSLFTAPKINDKERQRFLMLYILQAKF